MKDRIQVKVGISAEEHDAFVKAHSQINLLQSSAWAQVKSNWVNERIGFYQDNQQVASLSLLIKPLPLGLSMIYVPRGPVMDYSCSNLVAFVFSYLKRYARGKHALMVKCDPAIFYKQYRLGENLQDIDGSGQKAIDNLKKAGLKWVGPSLMIYETIQPRFQANRYLFPDFQEDFPKHTKRLMADAQKRGVTVSRAKASDLAAFADLISLTESRKHIHLRGFDYFNKLMSIYGDDAYLHLAKLNIPLQLEKLQAEFAIVEQELSQCQPHQKKKLRKLSDQQASLSKSIKSYEEYAQKYPEEVVVAGILSIAYGHSMEMLYAGMNEEFKTFYPQYLLYPKAFHDAYEKGIKWANMGGIEGDFSDGLTKFKSNFNPTIDEYIGEFNLPTSPLYYPFNALFKLRKNMRHKH